jgi:hypothetical protein
LLHHSGFSIGTSVLSMNWSSFDMQSLFMLVWCS